MNEIIKKNGITFGLISGLLSILITTLIYIIDLNLFTSWWLGVVIIITYIIVAVILMSKTKKELKGQFSFKEAFTTYFICALVALVLSVSFNIILFNFIDPGAKEIIKDATMKAMVQVFEKFDTPAAVANEALKTLKDNDQFSIANLLRGSLTNIIVSSIFGLLLAAIFKTKTIQE